MAFSARLCKKRMFVVSIYPNAKISGYSYQLPTLVSNMRFSAS